MKILIPSLRGVRGVEISNIIYCQADNNYTDIFMTENRSFTAMINLKKILELLNSEDFIRCHKSFAINLKYFEETDNCGKLF